MKLFPTAPVSRKPPTAGFTLLEVSVTMAILLVLAGGIFSITSSSFQLTSELGDFQNRNVLKKRFIELCRMNLEAVPGHAQVEFKIADRGQYYATYLSIVDDPFAFSFAGHTANVHRVILEADVASGGYLRASLLYLNEEENAAYEQEALDPSVVQRRVVLLERLRQLSWRFYDPGRQEWIEFWDQPRKPMLIELSLAMEDEVVPERAVFWIPPAKAVSVGAGRRPEDENDDDEEEEEENEEESEDEPDGNNPAPPVRNP